MYLCTCLVQCKRCIMKASNSCQRSPWTLLGDSNSFTYWVLRFWYKTILACTSKHGNGLKWYYACKVFSDYSQNLIDMHGLRSSTCPTYVVPRTRTKLGERAFSVSEPVAWNALPANICNTVYPKLFKHLLKTFLKSPVWYHSVTFNDMVIH